jgi:hypothetical protein
MLLEKRGGVSMFSLQSKWARPPPHICMPQRQSLPLDGHSTIHAFDYAVVIVAIGYELFLWQG